MYKHMTWMYATYVQVTAFGVWLAVPDACSLKLFGDSSVSCPAAASEVPGDSFPVANRLEAGPNLIFQGSFWVLSPEASVDHFDHVSRDSVEEWKGAFL